MLDLGHRDLPAEASSFRSRHALAASTDPAIRSSAPATLRGGNLPDPPAEG